MGNDFDLCRQHARSPVLTFHVNRENDAKEQDVHDYRKLHGLFIDLFGKLRTD